MITFFATIAIPLIANRGDKSACFDSGIVLCTYRCVAACKKFLGKGPRIPSKGSRAISRSGKKKGPNRHSKTPKSLDGAGQPTVAAISDNVVVRADTSPNQNGGTADQRVCQHYAIGNNGIDCKGHRTGLLTRDEIKQYGIIKNLNEKECLQITSYDLRLGEGHMVYDSADRKWLAKWVSDTPSPKDGNPPYLCEGSNIVIPRFGMALIQLRETIDLLSCIENTVQPVMICGHFDLKLSRVREGLISQQATQVEPGYQGKLFCYLFNQTGDDITLAYADISNSKIVTIEFQYVSCISQCDASIGQQFLKTLKKEHAKYSPPYCNPHGINDVRYFDGAPGELQGQAS